VLAESAVVLYFYLLGFGIMFLVLLGIGLATMADDDSRREKQARKGP
jgi:hypothetical protein